MATIAISQLPTQVPNAQIEIPATDPNNLSSAPTGTTGKYFLSDISNFLLEAQGLTTYAAVLVATTGALTVTYSNGTAGVGATLTNATTQAALSIDGVTLSVGNRVLVWNQSSTFQNGIYTVTNVGSASTNWVMTRSADFDMPSQIVQYGVVMVQQGSTYAGRLFQETGAGPWTIGTTPIVFALYSTSGQVDVGTINDLAYYAASGSVVSPLATANDGLLVTSNTGVPSILAGPGTTGQVLQSNAAAAPSFSTASYPSTAGTAGTILRSNATNWVNSTSTFADTYSVSTLLYAASANTVSGLATANSAALVTNGSGVPAWQALTAGQILVGTTAGAPAATAISSGSGILVANSSGSITVSATGGGIGWTSQASTPVTAAINTGYVITDASTVTLTLPTTAALGSVVRIAGQGAGGWILQPGAGQTIKVLTASASTSVASSEAFDCIEVVCTVANTTWVTLSMVTTGFTIT
jgi:hypothetical protein